MKTWITADLHFGHKEIITRCARYYRNEDEMDEGIINNWNSLISKDDLTYVLGDVSFRPKKETVAILQRLNGKKILIEGNNDRDLLLSSDFRDQFECIHHYLETDQLVLFHYPISDWNDRLKGTIHFHGHSHGKPSGIKGRVKDVCIDGNNMYPYNMIDLIMELKR